MRRIALGLFCVLALAWPAAAQDTPTARLPTPAIINSPEWVNVPNGRDFARFFPLRAFEEGVSGRVVLDCIVAADGLLGCTVASHEPEGYGFDDAGMRISRYFRMTTETRQGVSTVGGRVRVPIRFVAPERSVTPQQQR